jgi:hypothetical protein
MIPGARTGTDIFGGNFEKKRLKPGANWKLSSS